MSEIAAKRKDGRSAGAVGGGGLLCLFNSLLNGARWVLAQHVLVHNGSSCWCHSTARHAD